MGNLESFTNPNGGVTTYTYDKNQNVTSESVGDYYKVTYTYDAAGNVSSLTNSRGQVTTYEYDKAGRVIKQSDEAGTITYTYDANGNKIAVTETVSGNAVTANTITRTYDKAGNLSSIKDVKKDGTVINDYTYNYDQSGNITTITDKSVAKNSPQTATDSTVQMEYDSLNRLIKYNGKEVKYDADGNMIYGPLNGEMATFKYDCRNRLIETTTDSGETTQYAYDAENVRTKVIKNAGTQKETVTTYVTDSVSHELSRVLEATTTDKAGKTETILYTYGNGLVAQEKGKEYLLYHFNHLGSTTAVTDASGEIKYTYTYNIFGKLLTGSIDSSQSLNRYAYVEGNPVNFLDPFGLDESLYDELHKKFWDLIFGYQLFRLV